MSTILPHNVASVQIYNADMKCTAGGSQKYTTQKIRHLHTITKLCRAISSQLRHVSTIRKKLANKQYILDMSSQHGELQSTYSWDQLASLGHPSKFQQVLHLGFITAWTNRCVTNWFCICTCIFVWSLAGTWAGTLYVYFWGFLPLMEFCQVQRFWQFD